MRVIGYCMIPVGIAVGIYMYFFLKRIFKTFGADTAKKTVKILLIVLSVILGALAADYAHFPALIIYHILGLSLLLDLINLILKKVFKDRYESGFKAWKKIWGSGMVPVVLTAFIMIAGVINMQTVVETEYDLTTDKEIRAEGYKAELIADLHYGQGITGEKLKEVCERISDENADVIILCGDIVDNDTEPEEVKEAFSILGSIKSRYGIYYVYGNHDRSTDELKADYSDEFLDEAIKAAGITILNDETELIGEDIILIGREDFYRARDFSGRKSIEELTEDLDKDKFLLLADHQPKGFEEDAAAGIDLVVCGHTHGGQVWPAWEISAIIGRDELIYGTEKYGNMTAIVTSGIAGWGYPVKTEHNSEYVTINIKGE